MAVDELRRRGSIAQSSDLRLRPSFGCRTRRTCKLIAERLAATSGEANDVALGERLVRAAQPNDLVALARADFFVFPVLMFPELHDRKGNDPAPYINLMVEALMTVTGWGGDTAGSSSICRLGI